MKRTIDLDEEHERLLGEWMRLTGLDNSDETLRAITSFVLGNFEASPSPAPSLSEFTLKVGDRWIALEAKGADLSQPIRTSPHVMGGDACIRSTRIPVWLLVAFKQDGTSDSRILAEFPGLNAADLIAAWDYYAANTERIESERRRHEEAC